jgi:hypothetical protein
MTIHPAARALQSHLCTHFLLLMKHPPKIFNKASTLRRAAVVDGGSHRYLRDGAKLVRVVDLCHAQEKCSASSYVSHHDLMAAQHFISTKEHR